MITKTSVRTCETWMNNNLSNSHSWKSGCGILLGVALTCIPSRGAGQTAGIDSATIPRTAGAPDIVHFRNGDLLYGRLQAIDGANGLRWKHADVVEPIAFKL